MSYVDLIIKYLSGELSQEESSAFERELESNADLKAAFEDQSAAFRLIRRQLQKRDQLGFEAKLKEAMNQKVRHSVPPKASRRFWYLPPAIACILAIVLIIFLPGPANERIYARYYHPAKDPIVLACYQDTRGESEPGIRQYRQGNFTEAMELLSIRFSEEKENKLIPLFYLLSALELDRQEEILVHMGQEAGISMDLMDQSLAWYTALGHIKSDRRDEALLTLQTLRIQEGPYRKDAIRLEKIMLK